MALAAPGARGVIPPALHQSRQVSPTVRTVVVGGMVSATATNIITGPYASPLDGAVFMTMSPEGAGAVGGPTGLWLGHCTIQAWAANEVAALAALIDQLTELHLPVCPVARAVHAALATLPLTAPWESRPLGIRGIKPRRERYEWKDHTGRIVKIYKDTLRRHADPNCMCLHCHLLDAPPEENEEN
ncbi:MAG: hypothetical protein V4593_08200 [Pseudomonadota bacterium]